MRIAGRRAMYCGQERFAAALAVAIILSAVATSLPCPAAAAEPLVLDWAYQLTGPAGSVANTAVAVTAAGGIYVAGTFTGTVDFDLGVPELSLTASGDNDVFVAALGGEGGALWTYHLAPGAGGTIDASTLSLDVDGEGNVIFAGVFDGTIDFDSSAARHRLTSLSGSGDGFVMKLSSAGEFLWVGRISATEATVVDAVFDSVGDVYVAGNFFGAADVDPGEEEFPLTSLLGTSHFIAKWDRDGLFLWANQLLASTSQSDALGQVLAVDAAGNVLSAGTFRFAVEFETDPSKAVQASSTSVFLASLDPSGAVSWVKQLDQVDMDTGAEALDIDLDGAGNIYLSGTFAGALDGDPDEGTYVLTSPSGAGAHFLIKLTAGGAFQWAGQIDAVATGLATSVAPSGNVYQAGSFEGSIDVDPDPDVTSQFDSNGGTDFFVQSLRADGTFESAYQFGDSGADAVFHIGVDSSGAIYVMGEFTGTVDFDSGPGIYLVAGQDGAPSAFIMKLSPDLCTPPPAVTELSATDGLATTGVRLTWNVPSTTGAEYQVLRSGTDDIVTAAPISSWITETTYLDESAAAPQRGPLNCNREYIPVYTTYYYWVQWRVHGTLCVSEPSTSDAGYRGGTPEAPTPPVTDIAAMGCALIVLFARRPRRN